MADESGNKKPLPGRGRGLALLQALKKSVPPAAEKSQPTARYESQGAIPRINTPAAAAPDLRKTSPVLTPKHGVSSSDSGASRASSLEQKPSISARTLGRGIPLSLLQGARSAAPPKSPMPPSCTSTSSTSLEQLSKQLGSSEFSLAPSQSSAGVQSGDSSGRGTCALDTRSTSSQDRESHVLSSSGISVGATSSSKANLAAALGPPKQQFGKAVGRGALVAQFILNHEKQKKLGPEASVQKSSTISSGASVAADVPIDAAALELEERKEFESLVETAVIKKGTAGNRFSAACNWLRVSLDPRKEVYEYAVFFEPPCDARNLRFKLLSDLQEHIGSTKSFDGAKLWLPHRLRHDSTVLKTTHCITGAEVTVRIDLKHKTEMLNCIQLYNVLFNRVMKVLQMTKVGMNYYLPSAAFLVPQHKLQIWPGYVTAAHFMEGGIMLCVDTSHKVISTTTALEIMTVAQRTDRSRFESVVKEALVGSVVLTRYNNKTYIIDDVIFDETPLSTFINSRGETLTYTQYYKDHYNIVIKNTTQPLLVHKLKKKEMKDKDEVKLVCLIPELCYMTGMTDEMRADFKVMKDIAQHTRLSPAARQECLTKFVNNVNSNAEAAKILSDWGLTLDSKPLSLDGRTLPPEVIVFGSKEVRSSETADFSREATRERVLVPADMRGGWWLVIYTKRDERTAKNFVDMMDKVCRPMGLRLGQPKLLELPYDRVDAYVNAIMQEHNSDLQLATVIFPSQREDRYNAVKQVACSKLGLPTQCIVGRTISNDAKLRSVTVKIALQINCKLGGELWAIKIPMGGLMVCGIDVYHDPSRRGNSVASFVASTNRNLTRWYSKCTFQHPGDEIVNGLKVSLLESLKKYHEENQELPKSIIVYRDGVSDGQLTLVQDFEVPQLMKVFRNFDGYDPKLSFVVVQKRINTRIYSQLSGGNLGNPPPGSIMDHTVTKRKWYDFLLVSQHVRQGTVSPTHYIVLYDGVGLKVDNMQKLTYKMTYLYFNWPGTIRVPAPCQYAHKLSYLVGQNVRKPVKENLQDRLFYL